MEKLSEYQKMNLSEKDKKDYENAKQCYLCQKEFIDTDGKVRDHDHLSGAYRGAAHNSCNLKLRRQFKIPVFSTISEAMTPTCSSGV